MVHVFWMSRGNRGFSNCGLVTSFPHESKVFDCGRSVECLECIATGEEPNVAAYEMWKIADENDAKVEEVFRR